jgi:hypothetical protein
MGHVNNKLLTSTAKYYGINLTGKLKLCINCAHAKIKRHPIPAAHISRATDIEHRLFLDITHLPTPSIGANNYWLLVLDDATDFAFSFFLKNKSESPSKIIPLLDDFCKFLIGKV